MFQEYVNMGNTNDRYQQKLLLSGKPSTDNHINHIRVQIGAMAAPVRIILKYRELVYANRPITHREDYNKLLGIDHSPPRTTLSAKY